MNHFIVIANVRTIFGHTPALGNTWTENCLTSRTPDGLMQKLAPLANTAGPRGEGRWKGCSENIA